MQTAIERNLPQVEAILGGFKEIIGRDARAYRHHVYRVVNLCYAAGSFDDEQKQKIQIAAAFHDIGIWTAATLDYLPPSIVAAQRYLAEHGREAWSAEVSDMIEMHHRTKSCREFGSPLVEAFRRADIADFSLGLFPMGLPRSLISALKAEFPNSGFHLRLLQLGSVWFFKHPLNPLPMFRF